MMAKLNPTVRNKKYYQLLSVYWLILPVLFLSYLVLKAGMEKMSIQEVLMANPLLAVMLLLSLVTPFSSLFLLKLPESEKSLSKAAGSFIKFALVQQLVVGNLLGVGLCFLTLKELPKSGGERQKVGLSVIIVFEVVVTVIALFAMTRLMMS